MRIGIAGKGGAGKTTMAATMARLFARHGFTRVRWGCVAAVEGGELVVDLPDAACRSLERWTRHHRAIANQTI